MLGTFMLMFGWMGFNPGSALLLPTSGDKGAIAAHAAVTTVLSAASATLSSMLWNGLMVYRKSGEFELNIFTAMNGW
jgi:ammonium transporter, Amt family